jgi:hypothetical protein
MQKMEVRVSKLVIYYYISIAILTLFLSIFLMLKWGKMFLIFGVILSIALFTYSQFLKSKVIYVSEVDANFKCWFISKSIRQIESIDVMGFWVLNHICIVGRGGSVIKLKFVDNLKEVSSLALAKN